MGNFGPSSGLVERLIDQAGHLTVEEAADLYRARASHSLRHGLSAERQALARAERAAKVAGLRDEYELARREAVKAWRTALPETQGPWLVVGQAIGDAAGAFVLASTLDHRTFQLLSGPWRQAMGTLTPVGPGISTRQPVHR